MIRHGKYVFDESESRQVETPFSWTRFELGYFGVMPLRGDSSGWPIGDLALVLEVVRATRNRSYVVHST